MKVNKLQSLVISQRLCLSLSLSLSRFRWLAPAILLIIIPIFSVPPTFAQGTAPDQSTAQQTATTPTDSQAAAPTPTPQQQTRTKTATLAATGDSSAGSIGGTLAPESTKVSNRGAATQKIPIVVPPGTADIEPKVSFGYNSQGENGLLGAGWSVSGLPAISRCHQTLAQDNFAGTINNDTSDRFCLDGQRLMAINGRPDGADGAEYRTEVDSFLKITSFTSGGIGGSGPAYFIVKTKGGETMEFGNADDSYGGSFTLVRIFKNDSAVFSQSKPDWRSIDIEPMVKEYFSCDDIAARRRVRVRHVLLVLLNK